MDEPSFNLNPAAVEAETDITIDGSIPMASPLPIFGNGHNPLNNHQNAGSPNSASSHTQTHFAFFQFPQLFTFEEPAPVVEFTTREMEPQTRYWASSLIGHFVGEPGHLNNIQDVLEGLWDANLRVRELANDVILINVLDESVGDRILGGSPWELPTSFLFLQLWESNASPAAIDIKQVPTWIQVDELPLEYWPFHHLSRVLKPVGTLICIEQDSLLFSDLRWIRAMVMVDVTTPRVHRVHVHCGTNISTAFISYQGNHRVCIKCGALGHHHGGCGGAPGSGKDWSRRSYGGGNNNNLHQHNAPSPNPNPNSNAMGDEQQGEHQANDDVGNEAYDMQIPVQTDDLAVVVGGQDSSGLDYLVIDSMIQQYAGQSIQVESLSSYSTASATSLDASQEGGWRMSVPDYGAPMEDLADEDNMLLDKDLCPSGELLNDVWPPFPDSFGSANNMQIVTWTPTSANVFNNGNGLYDGEFDSLIKDDYGSGLLNMILEPRKEVEEPKRFTADSEHTIIAKAVETDTCTLVRAKRTRATAIKADEKQVKGAKLGKERGTRIQEQFEIIVAKVERAIKGLPFSSETKNIRKSFSMAVEEVRDFTKLLEENSKVEGMLMKGDQADVVVLTSDSSDGSDGRGKKRKSRASSNWEKATAVSSRIRGKLKLKQQTAAVIIKKSHKKKLARTPVRKGKANPIRISTALTLAPPSPGTDVK